MARSRTVEPHRAHDGCSRCSAIRATLLDDPHRLQRKSTIGSPVEGDVRCALDSRHCRNRHASLDGWRSNERIDRRAGFMRCIV